MNLKRARPQNRELKSISAKIIGVLSNLFFSSNRKINPLSHTPLYTPIGLKSTVVRIGETMSNRLSMDLSDLTLAPTNFDEETWLMTGPENEKNGGSDDGEDLNKWLEGAVRKVDFRTRSALSRRLDRKSRCSLNA